MERERGARGCLLGLAVADALGAPHEFTDPATARAVVMHGLEMSGGGGWDPGEWTDDTAMALRLAECIVDHGLPLELDDLVRRYAAWAATPPMDIGLTTRASLTGVSSASEARENARQYHESAGRSAGNGTVMRAAPIALATDDAEEASQAARADAALTHHDPAAGACSAGLCRALMAVRGDDDPLEAAQAEVRDHPEAEWALNLVAERRRREIEELAGGPLSGVAWPTLAVALWALLEYEYEEGVAWAISLGRDTDTNGAVAGALLGARDGPEAIPDRWLEPLRDRARVEGVARALAERAEATARWVPSDLSP